MPLSVIPNGSECGFDHLDVDSGDRNHIEADLTSMLGVLSEKPSCYQADAVLLARIDRRCCTAESVVDACLHLDENEHIVATNDEVDLAATASPVALDHFVAVFDVPSCRLLLTPPTASLIAEVGRLGRLGRLGLGSV